MHCCLTIPQFKTLSDFSVDFSHAAMTSLQLPSAQAKRDLINFFPCFKKNDIALGFKVVSGYEFQSYGYVFPISLAKKQTKQGF